MNIRYPAVIAAAAILTAASATAATGSESATVTGWAEATAGDNTLTVNSNCTAGLVTISATNTTTGDEVDSSQAYLDENGQATLTLALTPGTYTATVVTDCGTNTLQTITVTGQGLPIACTAVTALPGDDIACQILTSSNTSENITVTTNAGEEIPAQQRAAGQYWIHLTMPSTPVTLTATARTSSGDVAGTSRPLTLTPDDNANLSLTCHPVHPTPAGTITCTARSETSAGSALTFIQGDWRTTIRTVKNWTHHTVDVPAPTAPETSAATVRVELTGQNRALVDTAELTLPMSNPNQDTDSTPPALMYAIGALDGVECPDGWGRSWQAWAAADVCETNVNFNTETGQYNPDYEDVQAIIERYNARAEQAATPSSEGTLVTVNNQQWTVLDTQKVFFAGTKDTGLDARDNEIIERVLGVLSTYPDSTISVSGYADTLTIRNERIDAVNQRLTARGVPGGRITITPGNPDASQDIDRVDLAVLAPADTPVRTLAKPDQAGS